MNTKPVKMKRLAGFLGLCLAMTAPAAWSAQTKPNDLITESAVLSGKVTPDPAMGYIFVRMPRGMTITLMRVPDAETVAAWEQDRQKALAKAIKNYPGDISTWEDDVALLKKARPKDPLPPRPAEPTLEAVEVLPQELRDLLNIGIFRRYAKGTAFDEPFLVAVKPGTYFYAGTNTTCMCMGTVAFDVLPGKVTNLGATLLDKTPSSGSEVLQAGTDAASMAPAGFDMTVPDSLKAWPVMPAELHAHGKFNNYFRVIVNRMPAIPGVLSYRRDTVIDERTGQALPNPKLVAVQKPKL